jgi:hypothetical protein
VQPRTRAWSVCGLRCCDERPAERYSRATAGPPIALVRFGSLRRGVRFRRCFGFDRGTPIDRHHIDNFFRRYLGSLGYLPATIRGAVLEIGDPTHN